MKRGERWVAVVTVVCVGICLALALACGGGGGGGGGTPTPTAATVTGTVLEAVDSESIAFLGGGSVSYPSTTTAPKYYKSNAPSTSTTITDSDGSFTISDVERAAEVTITITKHGHTAFKRTIDTTIDNPVLSGMIQKKGRKRTKIPTGGGNVHTFDEPTLPKCKIDIPADALSEATYLDLTPYHQMSALPAGLPGGYTAIAGADFSSDGSDVTFATKAEGYVILPDTVRAEDLSTTDIKLMEYINGNWVIANGKGELHPPSTDFDRHYFGPDPSNPAKIGGSHPWCYAVPISNATITGTVKNNSGTAIAGALVTARNSSATTDASGNYTLSNVVFKTGRSLITITAVAPGYKQATNFASVTPGQNEPNVDFTLESAASDTATVTGTVSDASDSSTITDATVSLTTAKNITKLDYNDGDTPKDLTDDTFYVTVPSWVTATAYQWSLTNSDGDSFTSTNETGSSVVINQLAVEAQGGGLDLPAGAFQVSLTVTMSGGATATITGGFLLEQSGLELSITDIKLPISVAPQVTLTATTNSSGSYTISDVPLGQTLQIQASADGYATSDTETLSALSAGESKTHNISLTAITSDTEAPTAPTGLTVLGVTEDVASIAWLSSTDNIEVTGYEVLRDGTVIGTTEYTAWYDTNLSSATSYSYTVKAYDAIPNKSDASDAATATTEGAVTDTENPTAPTGLTATASSTSQINLSWSASSDNIGVVGYSVYRGTSEIAQTTERSYSDTGLSESTTYSYTVEAYDDAGNTSTESDSTTATTLSDADETPPTTPANLQATAVSSGQIDLAWTASTDADSGLAGYHVYRNNVKIATVITTSYSDSGLLAATAYTYAVTAYDNAGNISSQSSSVSATTHSAVDTTAPSVPAGLSATAAGSTQINLMWDASTDSESSVAGYYVYRDGVLIGDVSSQ